MVEVSTTWATARPGVPITASATANETSPSGRLENDYRSSNSNGRDVIHKLGISRASLRSRDIVGDDAMSERDKVRREATTHVPKSNEADDCHQVCSLLRTSTSARFAAMPAGAPQ